MKPRAAVSWSGGKDSYLALHLQPIVVRTSWH
jgi:diphthamide synthase (EF-2-diphthine--ammonia ligase)